MTWILITRLPRLLRYSFLPQGDGPYHRFSIQRVLVMLVFWPVFIVLSLINQCGLLLDQILFPRFKQVAVVKPLLVVGVPRSGTTFMHRLLACDEEEFTTMRLWELIFAPSISQRYFWHGLAKLDSLIGRPLGGLMNWVESKALSGLDDVHATGLQEPEEDYFALTPILGCFLLLLPFGDPELCQLSTFDRDANETEKNRLTSYYHRVIQRHLYFHGQHKTYLSKNPSFTPFLYSLVDAFPDAQFVACVRTPNEAIPSQISSIMVGTKIFSGQVNQDWWQRELINTLEYYYQQVLEASEKLPAHRYQMVRMEQLVASPMATVQSLYQAFNRTISEQQQAVLEQQEAKARQYKSKHKYSAKGLGIAKDILNEKFDFVYRKLGYERLA